MLKRWKVLPEGRVMGQSYQGLVLIIQETAHLICLFVHYCVLSAWNSVEHTAGVLIVLGD